MGGIWKALSEDYLWFRTMAWDYDSPRIGGLQFFTIAHDFCSFSLRWTDHACGDTYTRWVQLRSHKHGWIADKNVSKNGVWDPGFFSPPVFRTLLYLDLCFILMWTETGTKYRVCLIRMWTEMKIFWEMFDPNCICKWLVGLDVWSKIRTYMGGNQGLRLCWVPKYKNRHIS